MNCIAGDVASLPLFHYKRLEGGGKERLTGSRLYRVLHDEFNPEMSAMIGRETMQAHVLTWGNAYAEIQRNEAGQVVALWPIEPNRVQPYRETPTSPLRYRVTGSNGRQVAMAAEDVFHLKGLGYDGLQGYSVIAKARESIGAGLAAQQFTSDFYGNGVAHSGYFQHPKTLGETAHTRLKESIQNTKRGGFRILEEGMTFAPGSMPLKDAEFLGTRKFDVTEVARWYNIPPHKLADLERATFSNIEHQAIDYVVSCLRRWLVRWEQEILRTLIPPLERRQQFAEHLVDGLLRGDVGSRYAAYAIGRQWGWLSANGIRELENMNPIGEEGDVFLVPTNMAPADRVDEVIDAQVRPDPAPAAPAPAADDARVQAIVDDLRAEVVRRAEAIEAAARDLPAAIVAGLPAAPEPAAPLDLTGLVAALRVEPAPPVDLAPVLARVDALEARLTAQLATTEAFRAWQDATLGLIAGKLVRREVAHVKKRAADPERAAERLTAFYGRFVDDAAAELRPWVLRLQADPARVAAGLAGWARDAQAECMGALEAGQLGDLVRRWEIDREAALTRALVEAVHA